MKSNTVFPFIQLLRLHFHALNFNLCLYKKKHKQIKDTYIIHIIYVYTKNYCKTFFVFAFIYFQCQVYLNKNCVQFVCFLRKIICLCMYIIKTALLRV